MEKYAKEVVLSDGRTVLLRSPEIAKDLEQLVVFFAQLPPEVKNYLRYNVEDLAIAKKRLAQLDGIHHWRLIAELDGKIVGDATMDREPIGWKKHMAELRAVIDPTVDNLGIESVLIKQLVEIGAKSRVERVVVEVLKQHQGLIKVLEQEGFECVGVLKHHAKDQKGKAHDIVVMANDLEVVWKKLANYLEDMDIKLSRIYGGA